MMKSHKFMMCVIVSCFVLGLSACVFGGLWGDCGSKVEEEFKFEAEMADGQTFSAQTQHGFIKVLGTEQNKCFVTGTLRVWGKSDKEANEIAEQVKVDFKKNSDCVSVVLVKPEIQNNCGIGANYEVSLPRNTKLILKTTHGLIRCENVNGNIQSQTTHGRIECGNINGNLNLNTTHNTVAINQIKGNVEAKTTHGKIECSNIDGNLNLNTTHNSIVLNQIKGTVDAKSTHGKVECREIDTDKLEIGTTHNSVGVAFKEGIKGQIDADVQTTHGNIDFDLPVDFQGSVFMSTTHGKLNSEVPMAVKGDISKDQIKGVIGEGAGKVSLKTTHGSITLK